MMGAGVASADLTTGLVAYYPFDGNASDMSGNGHHGTVNGASLRADRHGKDGKPSLERLPGLLHRGVFPTEVLRPCWPSPGWGSSMPDIPMCWARWSMCGPVNGMVAEAIQ